MEMVKVKVTACAGRILATAYAGQFGATASCETVGAAVRDACKQADAEDARREVEIDPLHEVEVAAIDGRGKLAAVEREVAAFRAAHTEASGVEPSERMRRAADRRWLEMLLAPSLESGHNVGGVDVGRYVRADGERRIRVSDARGRDLGYAPDLRAAVLLLAATPDYALAARDAREAAAARRTRRFWVGLALWCLAAVLAAGAARWPAG